MAAAAYQQRRIPPSNRRVTRSSSKQNHKSTRTLACSGCGSSSHGRRDRRLRCPAWGTACDYCGIDNHFSSVCRDRLSLSKTTNHANQRHPSAHALSVPSHIDSPYAQVPSVSSGIDSPSAQALSNPQIHSPNVWSISVQAVHSCHNNISATIFPLCVHTGPESLPIQMFADTGADICLTSVQHLSQFNLLPSHLSKCDQPINVAGAALSMPHIHSLQK